MTLIFSIISWLARDWLKYETTKKAKPGICNGLAWFPTGAKHKTFPLWSCCQTSHTYNKLCNYYLAYQVSHRQFSNDNVYTVSLWMACSLCSNETFTHERKRERAMDWDGAASPGEALFTTSEHSSRGVTRQRVAREWQRTSPRLFRLMNTSILTSLSHRVKTLSGASQRGAFLSCHHKGARVSDITTPFFSAERMGRDVGKQWRDRQRIHRWGFQCRLSSRWPIAEPWL